MSKEIMQVNIDDLFGDSGIEIREVSTKNVIASYKDSRSSGKQDSNDKKKSTKTVVTAKKEERNRYA